MENNELQDVNLQNDELDESLEDSDTQEEEGTSTDQKVDPLDLITDPDELRNKAKGFRSVAQRRKNKPEPPKPTEVQDKKPETASPTEQSRLDKIEAKLNHPELTPEQIQSVFDYAKGTGKPFEEALKDPFIASALNAQKSKEEVKDAIPTSTNRGTAPKKVKQPKDMSSDEFKEYDKERVSKLN